MAGNVKKKNDTLSNYIDNLEFEELDMSNLIDFDEPEVTDKKEETEDLRSNLLEFSNTNDYEKPKSKRGRKKKIVDAIITNETDEIEENIEKPKSKRGRKKKIVEAIVPLGENTEENFEEYEEEKFKTQMIEEKPKSRRGRKRKNANLGEKLVEPILISDILGEKTSEEEEKFELPEDYNKEVKIQTNPYRDEMEITLDVRKCKVCIEKGEFDIYTNKSDSYIISKQPRLNLICKDSYIEIEKENEKYTIKTNQNFKLDYLASNLEKVNDIIIFTVSYMSELEVVNNELHIKIDETKLSESKLEDNKVLIISEEEGKVFLPYTKEDIKQDIAGTKNARVSDIIENKYVHPISRYKNSMKARFHEGYNLMLNKEHKSKHKAFMLGIELMFEFNLHPAIIAACKDLEELDIYLDCLEDNELEKFSCFKIIYKTLPMISKKNKKEKYYA